IVKQSDSDHRRNHAGIWSSGTDTEGLSGVEKVGRPQTRQDNNVVIIVCRGVRDVVAHGEARVAVSIVVSHGLRDGARARGKRWPGGSAYQAPVRGQISERSDARGSRHDDIWQIAVAEFAQGEGVRIGGWSGDRDRIVG